MKLLDLYEDIFQYVCKLNRAAKTQAHPELARVRGDLKVLLEQPARNASGDVHLANQVKRMELPIIFFIDNLVCTSRLKFAGDWAERRLANDCRPPELAGDDKFFELLEPDLMDPSEEASDRLAVYYVCLGLGFTGMYVGQPNRIRGYMDQIYPRISKLVDRDPKANITQQAYDYTNANILTEPPNRKITLVAIAFVFLCLTTLVVYYALYAQAVADLKDAVVDIQHHSEGNISGP